MNTRLARGMVVMVGLDPVKGHEQAGVRPAIVVSEPAHIRDARFPLVAVLPVTRTVVKGPFSVPLPAGAGGLRSDSCALIDQIRAIDVRRISHTFSILEPALVSRIDAALRKFLGL